MARNRETTLWLSLCHYKGLFPSPFPLVLLRQFFFLLLSLLQYSPISTIPVAWYFLSDHQQWTKSITHFALSPTHCSLVNHSITHQLSISLTQWWHSQILGTKGSGFIHIIARQAIAIFKTVSSMHIIHGMLALLTASLVIATCIPSIYHISGYFTGTWPAGQHIHAIFLLTKSPCILSLFWAHRRSQQLLLAYPVNNIV